jgi:hypothetical protein
MNAACPVFSCDQIPQSLTPPPLPPLIIHSANIHLIPAMYQETC